MLKILPEFVAPGSSGWATEAIGDLRNVAPRIAGGGLLVFDDLVNRDCPLARGWTQFKEAYASDFVFLQNLDDH